MAQRDRADAPGCEGGSDPYGDGAGGIREVESAKCKVQSATHNTQSAKWNAERGEFR